MTLLFVKNTVESPFLFRDRNHPVIILPEKKNPAVFLQISAAFRFFSGNYLKYRAISKIFPEKCLPILEGSTRYFSREKKRKSINIIIFPFILEKYLVEFLEISGSRIFY